jgi:HD-like signal output (HDOD) protein
LIGPINIDPKTFLRQHCTLPALPEVLIRMQEILDSDYIDIDEVAVLIRGDPALVGQILKMVNSAYYGLPREVADVKYAIGFLGLNETHRIMLSFAIADAFVTEHKEELKELWFHSFHTALCADYLAKKDRALKYPLDCWSAALLHDVGKLVYLKFFPDHFIALKEYALKNGCLFSTAEVELDLPPSAYLGALLCDHWRLPLIVRDSCESHSLEMLYEAVQDSSQLQVAVLVSICNLLSTLSTAVLASPIKEEIASATMRALNYDQAKFADLMTVVQDLKTDAEKFMHQVT